MNFYNKTGKMALGSRLRRLSELMTEQAGKVYGLYDIDMQPKWFPVFYALSEAGEKTITQIALEIGHSHPSVSTIVKEMIKGGLVEESPERQQVTDKTDKRKTYIKLSEAGLAVNDKIQAQYQDVNAAVESALAETQYNIWKAIEEWEFLLGQKDLLKRVQEAKKNRESKAIAVVEYQPQYKAAFKQLNEAWITQYFKMEEADHKSLDHPEEYILDGGGFIFFALDGEAVAGTCALMRMDDDTFELAKMAVSATAKGKGIGSLLGNSAIKKAKSEGANKLYLESNTRLVPAINLYHKLGFKKVTGPPSPYERANIQMELKLS